MSIHGSRGVDQKVFISGLSTMLSAMSQDTPYIANMGSTQEMTIATSRSPRRSTPTGRM
jgi:hypothetical protein